MKLSNREFVIGWLTFAVLLFGGTYWFGESKWAEWKAARAESERWRQRIQVAQRMLDQREEWMARLEEIRSRLPGHPEGKDVTAELLKMLEREAQQHGLTLLRREPEDEKSLGDLYEVAINCTWEGPLDALVHFLYAIHTKGVILDVRQLTVSPIPGEKGRLKGGFTVDFAYSRAFSNEGPQQAQAQP